MSNLRLRFLFCVAAGLGAAHAPSFAHAQSADCTPTTVDAADYGLPATVASAEATLSSCTDGDYLSVRLNLGPDTHVLVSGRLDVAEPCLRSTFEQEIWPGLFGDDQVVTICRAPDGAWTASLDATANIEGARASVSGAAFELGTANPSFRIAVLELGPFVLEDVVITTALDGAMTTMVSMAATLPLALPGGGTLALSGDLDSNGLGFGLDLAGLPADFPFPGVTIPSTSAKLTFHEEGWGLEFSFQGMTEIGPLGELPVDAGTLRVEVDAAGQWALAGCLSSAPVNQSVDVLELTGLEVDICAATNGEASVAWTATAELPSLGFGPSAISGAMSYDAGVYSGTARFTAAVPAGALGPLNLDGALTVSGGNGSANVSGCLRTVASSMTVGGLPASLSFAVGDTCNTGPAFDVSFAGTMQIANQNASATGKVSVSADSWSSVATLANVSLGNYQLEAATLTMASTGAASLNADLTVGPFALTVAGEVAGSGAFTLGVGLRASADLGNGIVIDDVAGSSLSYDGSTWSLILAIGGSATVAGNAIDVDATYDATYDEATSAWTFKGCIEAAAVPAELPLTAASAEICFADGTASLRVSGLLALPGGAVAVSGSYAPDADSGELVLTLEVSSAGGKLMVAPGIELEQVRLTVNASTPALNLQAALCLGGLCMNVTGAYNPNGASYLDLDLEVTGWQPFPTLGLPAFTGTLSGRIELADDGTGSVTYQVASSQSFELVQGLTLRDVFAGGRVNTDGEWKLELGGDTSIAFGAYDFDLTLRGSVDSLGTWTLSGASDISFEPLEALVGGGVFVVKNPVFAVSAAPGALDVELRADLDISVVPGGAPLAATVRGGLTAGGDAGVWFVGRLDGLTLPSVRDGESWALPALTFAATSSQLVDFDLFDTPADASDDVTLETGITLTTIAQLPANLVENQPDVRLSLYVGDSGLKISGTLNVNYDLIVPEYRVPTISTVTFNSFEIDASITTSGKLAIGFGATSSFTPRNSTDSLLANVRIEVGYQAPRIVFAGQLSIAGRWIEPFGIPRITMQDPAFKLGFAVTSSLPAVPMLNAIGVNGDAMWLKSGDWPAGFASTDVPAPKNIVHAGASFYLELDLTPSGICIGACLPLPPIVARVELHNVAASELVAAANEIKDGLRDIVLAAAPKGHAAKIAQAIPDAAFGELNIEPLDIKLKDVSFYLSTHNIEPWPGIRFKAGMHADLDLRVGNHHTTMHGQLSTDGLLLEGRLDPINIGSFVVTGDPFAKVANLSASTSARVQVASHSSLTLSEATIEGWIRGSGNSSGNLMQRAYRYNQIQVGMTAAEDVCDDQGACVSRSRARLYLRDLYSTQTLVSEPIMVPGQWHHLAAVIADDELRLVVDGSVVASVTRTARPSLVGTTLLGSGLQAIDEVRLWNVPRSAADIAAYASRMSPGSYPADALLARYSFDFDTGSTAYNSRPGVGSRHGSYVEGAPAFDPRDQKVLFQINLLLSQLGDSGALLRGGVSLDPTGNGTPIAFSTELTARVGGVTGSLYAPSVQILELPGMGTLAVRGAGPNLTSGDFDDGVHAAFDLMAGSFTAAGQLELRDDSGETSTVGSVSIAYQCPSGATCADASSHQLDANGTIDLSADLGSLGNFRLQGTASYSSASERLDVSGGLTAFGLSLVSGSIRVDRDGIRLTAPVDPGAAVGLNLGSMLMSLDYQYAPARICGSGTGPIHVPGIPEAIDATATACFGSSPSLSLSGSARSITLAGIPLNNVSVGYSSSAGISIAGDVSIAGVFSGRVSGYFRSSTDFSLTGSAALTLAGFTMSNATITLGATGLSASGSVNLKVMTANTTVSFDNDGSFTASGVAQATLAGFRTQASYSLTERGLSLSGDVDVLGTNWGLEGSVRSDGSFMFEGRSTLAIQGFTMSNATVSLARYTSAHPRRRGQPYSGLRVGGSLSLPYGNSAALTFTVGTNGTFRASASTAITLNGWSLANSRVQFDQNELTVTGNMSIPGGSLAVNTRLRSNGYFSFSANPSLDLGGFALADTYVRLNSGGGLYLRGNVTIGTSSHQISGDVSGPSDWELCTSSSTVSPTMSSGLPSLRGSFCLKKTAYQSTPRLIGEGRATYLGQSFDTSFRISASGGLDYLYITQAPQEFSLLGVKATGSVRLYVSNNSLKYLRWYGSLKMSNGLVDFNSHLTLSKYQLCPSHFGVPKPPRGIPNGCASLLF